MSTNQNTITFRLDPRLRRFIHVSRVNRQLMVLLTDFFAEGLVRGDQCVAVLTPRNQRRLYKNLISKGVDVEPAIQKEQLFLLNTRDIRLLNGLPKDLEEVEYYKAIESISTRAASDKQPVRAFGENISLRWPRFRLYVPQNE